MVRTILSVLRSFPFTVLLIVAVTFFLAHSFHDHNRSPEKVKSSALANTVNPDDQQIEDPLNVSLNFDGFNNVTGADEFIVPNIIHFIRYNRSEFSFIDYIVLKAAMRNHKPDSFFYHSDIPDTPWTGKYWDWVRKDRELVSRIKMLPLEVPKEIFGKPLSEGWRFYHGSDIGRIQVLMKYGGIYLDRDVYVVQNLNKYRNYEFVLNWDENQPLGNQVLIAHKDARFLRLWLESYKDYRSDLWYYNAGDKPTAEIITPHPELIHRVKGNFGTGAGVAVELYSNPQLEWRKLETIHLLVNHRYYLDRNYNKTPIFNEVNIQSFEFPFGEMAREVVNKP